MIFNIDIIKQYYHNISERMEQVRELIKRPLSFTEKVLFSHLSKNIRDFERGKDYAEFNPDRVAMQDATAQMALLQFMMAGRDEVATGARPRCP